MTEGDTLSETDAGWCLSRSPELPCSFEHCRESIAACVESDKDSICTAPSVPTSTSLAVRRCATNLGQPLYCQMGSGPCHQARSQSSRPLQRTIPKLPEKRIATCRNIGDTRHPKQRALHSIRSKKVDTLDRPIPFTSISLYANPTISRKSTTYEKNATHSGGGTTSSALFGS